MNWHGRLNFQTVNPGAILDAANYATERFRPREALTPSQWADRFAWVPDAGNSEPGKYLIDRCPYQKEMLDDFADNEPAETVWQIASQLGKTLCIILACEYFSHWVPSPILVVYPTLDSAKAFSIKKFMPTIRATEAMGDVYPEAKARTSGNTILNKVFIGGDISIAGANSAPTLRQQSKKVVICDELDAYQPNAEGDPEAQADKRAETFSDAVKLKSSTPTIKGISPIENKFEASDKQFWFVPCPHCKEEQTLVWAQVKFDPEKPENAFYQCKHCLKGWTDGQRINAILSGRWKATAPFKGIRGRHLNGIYRIMGLKDSSRNYLHEFALEFLKAKRKGRFALMVWTNTFLAETFEEFGERIDDDDLLKRREDYTLETVPEKALVVTAATDVQGDRLEAYSKAWAPGEEGFALEYKVFPGNPLRPEVWRDWLEWIETARYHTADGRELPILQTAVDSGAFTETVYEVVKPLFSRRIVAIKGSNQIGAPIAGTLSRSNRKRCPVYRIGTHQAKLVIYSRFGLREHGPGFYHYPEAPELGFDERWFAGVTAEEITTQYYKGFPKKVFVLPAGRRNEPLDLEVYALAALLILNPNWKALAKKAGQGGEKALDQAEKVQESSQRRAGARPRPSRRLRLPRKNWIKNY